MAFPWLFSSGFERGTNGEWSSETDASSLLDFPHYTELARFGLTPYRGAYCMRFLPNAAADAFVVRTETIALAATWAVRVYVRADQLTLAASDRFSLVELQSAGDVVEAAMGIQRTAGGVLQWWCGENAASATIRAQDMGAQGVWTHLEMTGTLDSGAPNDGILRFFVDDGQVGANITALDQAAIAEIQVGGMGLDAGTTAGRILYDDFIADDLQIFRDRERFLVHHRTHFTEDHPIIGPGKFSVAVTGTGTNAVLTMYDSDGVDQNLEPLAVIRNVSANEFVPGHTEFIVHHGLYCTLAGTAAQAFFDIVGGNVVSEGRYKSFGNARGRPHP